MTDYSQNLRRRFADGLYTEMKANKKIIVLSGDLGYKVFDKIRVDFPDRFLNIGAAEQALVGIAVGMALEGVIPVVYSISPFLLYRPFETIRNYIHHEKIPVKLIGSGRDKDYSHDGFSHWSCEDKQVMKILSNIKSSWPNSANEVSKILPKLLHDNNPWYLNLKR
ncbi:MAG: hypothetical protein HOC16_00425 [Candidatus Pacebacteria bacterium]|jgi:transketolase|nr:hypothetical protein [Candidatus Paceibacterota bacterium]